MPKVPFFGGVPSTKFEFFLSSQQSRGYYQNAVLYITKAKPCISSSRGKYTLARDEIQGRLAALDDILAFTRYARQSG